MLHEGQERRCPDDLDLLDQGRLRRIRCGHDDCPDPVRPGQRHEWQHAMCMAHRSIQGKFPEEEGGTRRQFHRTGSPKDAKCSRHIECRTFLAHFRWRKIDRDPSCGEGTSHVSNRRAYPFPRLLHRRIGHANDGDSRQPLCQVYLNLDKCPLKLTILPVWTLATIGMPLVPSLRHVHDRRIRE